MKKNLILFLIACASATLTAQQQTFIKRSEIIEKIGNTEYYMHHVLQGQTFVTIAEAYAVSVVEILKSNPNSRSVISPGDVIKIPKPQASSQPAAKADQNQIPKQTQSASGSQNKNTETRNAITHTVAAKETFFGIARQYNVSVDELRAANPHITGLQPGQIIKIPASDPEPAINQSQEIKTEAPVRNSPNENTSIPEQYTVQAGETLFFISRKFDLKVEDIKKLNPELEYGLKAGQTIWLRQPDNAIKPVEKQQFVSVKDTIVSYIYHKVKRGETIYSIARIYKIRPEAIIQYNPQAARGVKVRQTLQIPVYEVITREKPVETISTTEKEETGDRDDTTVISNCSPNPQPAKTYNVAIMLPFFLESGSDIILTDNQQTGNQADQDKSFEFIQFYLGALLALDSLKLEGLKAKVYVYDVNNTNESVAAVLARPELPSMDLIIGPFFSGSFERMARYAKEHKIPIINPLSPRSEFLINNPYAVKVQPTMKQQVQIIADYIKKHMPGSNIVVVRQYSFSENESVEVFRKNFKNGTLQEVVYMRDSLPGIRKRLDKNRDNIIVGLSNENVFVMDLIRKLNDIRADYRIVCFGLDEWEDFPLDTDHMVNLILHLPTAGFIDYTSPQVIDFIQKFRSRYSAEPLPDRYAFTGYDVTFYFLKALQKYGTDFSNCLPTWKYRGLQIPFSFHSTEKHGVENNGLFLYRIDNFSRIELYPGK